MQAEEILEQFNMLPSREQLPVRQYAFCLLLDENCTEICEQNIKNKVIALYKECKSFQEVLMKYMEYLFC